MKVYIRIVGIPLVYTLLVCVGCSQAPDYEDYGQKISSAFSEPSKLREIFEEISRDLAKHPDDHRLLLLRLQLSGILEDSVAYEADIYNLAELFPKEPDFQFLKCLTLERRSGLNDSVRKCYSDILLLYEREMEPGEYKHRWNYIVTALMAENPEAETLREQFIRNAGDDPSAWHDKQLLRYFDRQILVTGNIPPGVLENPPPPPALLREIPLKDIK